MMIKMHFIIFIYFYDLYKKFFKVTEKISKIEIFIKNQKIQNNKYAINRKFLEFSEKEKNLIKERVKIIGKHHFVNDKHCLLFLFKTFTFSFLKLEDDYYYIELDVICKNSSPSITYTYIIDQISGLKNFFNKII